MLHSERTLLSSGCIWSAGKPAPTGCNIARGTLVWSLPTYNITATWLMDTILQVITRLRESRLGY